MKRNLSSKTIDPDECSTTLASSNTPTPLSAQTPVHAHTPASAQTPVAGADPAKRRAVILLIVVGMLGMLFITLTAFIQIARFDRETLEMATSSDSAFKLLDPIAKKIEDEVAATTQTNRTAAEIPGSPGYEWLASPYALRMAPNAYRQDLRYAQHPNPDDNDKAWIITGAGLVRSSQNTRMVNPLNLNAVKPMFDMHYLSVSSYGGSSPAAQSGWGLAPVEVLRNVGQVGSDERYLNGNDWFANARVPWADADGDGVPDSSPLAAFGLTRLAHEVLGLNVAAPPSDQRDFEWEDNLRTTAETERERARWDRYLESNEYTVVARVISNGGQVQLSAGYPEITISSPMSQFVQGMTGWIYDNDPNDGSGYSPFDDGEWFKLSLAPESLERSLRRRGGLRPAPGMLADRPTSGGNYDISLVADDDMRPLQMPEIVMEVDRRLAAQFQSRLYALDLLNQTPEKVEDYSQRFNIADKNNQTNTSSRNDIQIWSAAEYLSPDDFNANPTGQLANDYGRRNLFGTANYSDDLAMQLEPDSKSNQNTPNESGEFGLLDGQLKFYLGLTDKAFDENGKFKSDDLTGDPNGTLIARTLVDYYYEMLGGHEGWDDDDHTTPPPAGTSEAVSRIDQAYMLAVNTLGAAAPYNENTSVIYTPFLTRKMNGKERRYYGYVPQLYITQVVTYTKPYEYDPPVPGDPFYVDPNETTDPNEIQARRETIYKAGNGKYDGATALAIEIYNPHDRPLSLEQYEFNIESLEGAPIRVSLADDPGYDLPGNKHKIIDARSFAVYIFNSTVTNDGVEPVSATITLPGSVRNGIATYQNNVFTVGTDPIGTVGGTVKVQLIRSTTDTFNATLRSAGYTYVVDEMKVGVTTPFPIEKAGKGGTSAATEYTNATVYRDTTSNESVGSGVPQETPFTWFGVLNYSSDSIGTPALPLHVSGDALARWRMATPYDTEVMEDEKLDEDKHVPDRKNGPGFEWSKGLTADTSGLGGAGPTATGTTAYSMPATVYYTQNPSNPRLDNPILDELKINGVARPAAYPTVGFLAFVPRFSHYVDNPTGSRAGYPMTKVLSDEFYLRTKDNFIVLDSDLSGKSDFDNEYDPTQPVSYHSSAMILSTGLIRNIPVDFGHMPFFDNQQRIKSDGALAGNAVPWGQLIFDFFTTYDPQETYVEPSGQAIDSYRIPGRININAASWFTLASLPVIDLVYAGLEDTTGYGLSPAFWDPDSGVLVGSNGVNSGTSTNPYYRRTLLENRYAIADLNVTLPSFNGSSEMASLGKELGQAIEAYRDRVETYYATRVSDGGSANYITNRYFDAATRDPGRSADQANGALRTGRGFFTLGELLNVPGFDTSEFYPQGSSPPSPLELGDRIEIEGNGGNDYPIDPVLCGDYYRAVSLLALLDSHFITTRSNTYTAYVSIFDRREPDNSAHLEMTIDRTNMSRRFATDSDTGSIFLGGYDTNNRRFYRNSTVVTKEPADTPEVYNQHAIGYYNTRFDQ